MACLEEERHLRAGYMLAEIGPTLTITIRRVEYDVAAAALAVRNSGLPAHFADLLETGGIAISEEKARHREGVLA